MLFQICLACLVYLCLGYNRLKSPILLRVNSRLLDASSDVKNEKNHLWINSDFSSDQINSWWINAGSGKALLTIGINGVKDSHINSLFELLSSQHYFVRVKLASDKYSSIIDVATSIANNPIISKQAILLQVRKREFLFCRKNSTLTKYWVSFICYVLD